MRRLNSGLINYQRKPLHTDGLKTVKYQRADPGLNADHDKQRSGMVTIHAPGPAPENVEQNRWNSRGEVVLVAER